MPNLRADLLRSLPAIERWRAAWDSLAVAGRRPFCSPAWMLAWWRHAAPPGAQLRVALALDGDDLIGVAPFWVEDWHGLARYRILASPASYRSEPVARAGREHEAAGAFAEVIAGAEPRPELVLFEAIPADSPWPALFCKAWPGPRAPWLHRDRALPAPTLTPGPGSFDDWLASKSRNFRQQMRRGRRHLEQQGGVFRLSTNGGLDRDLAAFATLHYARWTKRGGSSVLDGGVEAMLHAVAAELSGTGRFRVWSIAVQERAVSSHIFLEAGGELSYWLGGFDEARAAEHPSLLTLLAAVEHGWGEGAVRIDFGGGDQPYKYRFADGQETLEWWTLLPSSRRTGRARLRLAPALAYRAVAACLPAGAKQHIKHALAWAPALVPAKLAR